METLEFQDPEIMVVMEVETAILPAQDKQMEKTTEVVALVGVLPIQVQEEPAEVALFVLFMQLMVATDQAQPPQEERLQLKD
jgi:hypothetical protein